MSAHSKEPWKCRKGTVGCVVEEGICGHVATVARNDRKFDQPNAERIVACVNACAGMADPHDTIRTMIAALTEVRDHYFSQQDAARCRELAASALALIQK